MHVLFNPFNGHSINIPSPYFSFKLPQIKFKNNKYGIGKAFSEIEKNDGLDSCFKDVTCIF